MNESEARDENAKSLRSIAICQQIQTLILMRDHAAMSVDTERMHKTNFESELLDAMVLPLDG